MALLPFMPLIVDDWLTSPKVLAMTPAQQGVYLRLLLYQWRDGYLPNDPETLSRMAGISTQDFASVSPLVLKNFNLRKGRYRNAKLALLRKSEIERHSSLSLRGIEGGLAKARKMNEIRTTASGGSSGHIYTFLSSSKKLPLEEKTSMRTRENFPPPISPKNGYDPMAGWERLVALCQRKPVAPRIRKPDLACQQFISCCNSPEKEAEILAGVERYKRSVEVSKSVMESLENFLRDGMWKGVWDEPLTEAERLARL